MQPLRYPAIPLSNDKFSSTTLMHQRNETYSLAQWARILSHLIKSGRVSVIFSSEGVENFTHVVAASADHAAAAVGRPVRNDLATEPSGRGHALRGAGSRRSGSGDQDQEDGKPGHPEDSKVAL